MQRQCAAKEEQSPHVSFLRLLTSPLRLLCATIWHVVQERDVLNYGMLEDFVTVVTETIPELLNHRQRAQLILGLRTKVVFELCRSESLSNTKTIQHYLERIRIPAPVLAESLIGDKDVETSESNFLALMDILLNDPIERDAFFQEVFPVDYGPKFDLALERLIWTFVSRLEEVLPVPSLNEIASLLSVSPSVIKECFQALSQPEELLNSLNHHKNHARTETTAISPVAASVDDDCIFSCLSRPPLVRAMLDTRCEATETILESEVCEEVFIGCEEVSSQNAEVDTDDVQPEAGMSTIRGAKESTELVDHQRDGASVDGECLMGRICEEVKSDSPKEMATADDEQEESPSPKEATFPQGSGFITEALPEEYLCWSEHCYSRKMPVHGASEDALRGLCLQRQPTVRLERIDISDKPLPQPLPRQSGRVRKKNILMLWRKNRGPEIAWLIEPGLTPKTVQSDKPKTAKSGVKPPAMVFACSKCSFKDVTGTSLEQHIRKEHPDEFRGLLSTGMIKTGEPEHPGKQTKDVSVSQTEPPKIALMFKARPIGTKTSSDITQPLQVPTKTQCTSCGKLFQHLHDLRNHMSECSDVIKENPDLRSGKSNKPGSRGQNGGTTVVQEDARKLKQYCGVANNTGITTEDKRVEQHFKCFYCPILFSSAVLLKKHIETSHDGLGLPPKNEKAELSRDGPQDQRADTVGRYSAPLPDPMNSNTCPACGRIFMGVREMRKHYRMAHGEGEPQRPRPTKAHPCPTCGKIFHRPCEMRRHHLVKHGGEEGLPPGSKKSNPCPGPPKAHPCPACGRIFHRPCEMQRHFLVNHCDGEHLQSGAKKSNPRPGPPKAHPCPACGKIFHRLSVMERHYLVKHGGGKGQQLESTKSNPCPACRKIYKRARDLRRHLLIKHGGQEDLHQLQPQNSKTCPANENVQAVKVTRQHLCYHCGKCFESFAALLSHEMIHGEERPYICPHCGKAFKRPINLKIHLRTHQSVQERARFICTFCGKALVSRSTLERHRIMHSGIRAFKCKECPKSFLTRDELAKHSRYHTGVRPFVCNECGKSFVLYNHLKLHMYKHTGEKPFACSVCDKRFRHHSDLKRHLRIHTKGLKRLPVDYSPQSAQAHDNK